MPGSPVEPPRFVVVSAVHNMEPWVEDNVRMLRAQTYPHFRCFLVDDCSTDASVERMGRACAGDPRFRLLHNESRSFSLGSIVHGIDAARPNDEEVIVLVDGDDYLAHPGALEHVARIYSETGCWLTYGSNVNQHGQRDRACRPYPPDVVARNRFRDTPWHATHLKTFKHRLWREIQPDALTIEPEELRAALARALRRLHVRTWLHWRKFDHTDLLDPSGRFVRRADDKAIMYPLLELSGRHSRFVPEILYVYRTYEKPLPFGSPQVEAKWYQRCISSILLNKTRYTPLPDEPPMSGNARG